MKNPMTLQQKHQALDDADAGHPMQYRPFHSKKHNWVDCADTKRSLNFMVNEYRRKPEETNPWRPIFRGEWPRCKPNSRIIIRYPNGATRHLLAGDILWLSINATHWCYEEDE